MKRGEISGGYVLMSQGCCMKFLLLVEPKWLSSYNFPWISHHCWTIKVCHLVFKKKVASFFMRRCIHRMASTSFREKYCLKLLGFSFPSLSIRYLISMISGSVQTFFVNNFPELKLWFFYYILRVPS